MLLRRKLKKGEFFEYDVYFYEISQNGDEICIWECAPTKQEKFAKYINRNKPLDIFFCIGEGRVYVEEGRFNTKDEVKKKILDKNGYLNDNPNYTFKQYDKDINLFRYCKLG